MSFHSAPPAAAADLPPSTCPNLHLAHPTPAECQQIWKLIHPAWGDSLTLPQFLAESAYLLTVPLARDGGMTLWVLVDRNLLPDERPILASCETFKKKGLLSNADNEVQDVVLHGIASVFCDPEYRGRGYAQRMMRELGEVLKTWQVGLGETCIGSVLYSDIGKEYYAKLGWTAVGNNSHLEFPAKRQEGNEDSGKDSAKVSVVLDADLKELCSRDEALVRQRLADSRRNELMILPDEDHMRWHHAKEEFVSERVFGKGCPTKGVLIGEGSGKNRVWAIWTRRFYGKPETARRENTLYILRLVFERRDLSEEDLVQTRKALTMILQAAQAKASRCGLGRVKLWDPSPHVIELMKGIDIQYRLVERHHECIASLMWYGDGKAPEWCANEKYAWL